jgi:hypothetical protein
MGSAQSLSRCSLKGQVGLFKERQIYILVRVLFIGSSLLAFPQYKADSKSCQRLPPETPSPTDVGHQTAAATKWPFHPKNKQTIFTILPSIWRCRLELLQDCLA